MTGPRHRRRSGIVNLTFSRMSAFKAVCLSVLHTCARTQILPLCATGTHFYVVEDTESATNLSSLLQCSSGTFNVSWIGEVVVAETIHVADGTSLNITGATSEAVADGKNSAQLFMVDGASSLHLTDMILTNGNASLGGAVHVVNQSRVSWSGDTRFTTNAAEKGGAIYAHFSTVAWDGDTTVFSSNSVYGTSIWSGWGGAIFADYYSDVSWGGMTVLTNNTATSRGGALHVNDHSSVSFYGNTTFLENFAQYGGAIVAYNNSDASWDGMTAFINNAATNGGGALFVYDQSRISFNGNTTFLENSAVYGGAIGAYDYSEVSWDGVTVFTNNRGTDWGGALFVYDHSSTSGSGNNTFLDNSAVYGGAITAYYHSDCSWEGLVVFRNNIADDFGGALYVYDHSSIACNGSTTFLENYASCGGAIAVYLDSMVCWDGMTVFTSNTATANGGAVFVDDNSNLVCNGSTAVSENYAQQGAGMMIDNNSGGSWNGTTVFNSNVADGDGGGLTVRSNSEASWTGAMTFAQNIADRAGAIAVWDSDVSWTGTTTFADNIAESDGGALYATLTYSLIWDGVTTFRNNTATNGNGGALGLYGSLSASESNVNCSGETTFTSNKALGNGGAMFSAANRGGQYFENTTFQFNSALVGGAIATFGTGNGDDVDPVSSQFVGCTFFSNTATETGGAVESTYGQEEFVNSYFDGNFADVGGALRLGGATAILGCSFISNVASSRGLAIAAVGSVNISNSEFDGNVFYCDAGEFMEFLDEEDVGMTRYETICDGCPSMENCIDCLIRSTHETSACSIALDDTTADQAGTELATLNVSKGYWRATDLSTTILECYNKEACLGGLTGATGYCDEGYEGPYCAVCKPGYSVSLGATCTRCSETKRQGFVAAAVIIVVVAVCAMGVFSAYLVSTEFEEREASCLHRRILRAVPLQAFKIVIVVWQILTQFTSVVNVTYPGVYQELLSTIDVIDLDLGSIISTGCLFQDVDFHDRLFTVTIAPLVFMGLLALTYAVALRRNAASGGVVVDKIRHKHLSALLFLTFVVYSSISSTVFQMFACDPLDDDNTYLRADYRLLCTDTKHQVLQVYAGIMIAVYPVGIPLIYGILLYLYRDTLVDSRADKAGAQPIADLWAPYRPERFYYEVIECGRRIMLTGVVVFIYPNDAAQIAITFLIAFFFFAVSEVLSPLASGSDMWLSRGGHVIVLLSMFDTLLLKVDVSDERSESQKVFAGVLVAGHVLMVLTVVVEAIAICYASRRILLAEEDVPCRRVTKLRPQNILVEVEAERPFFEVEESGNK